MAGQWVRCGSGFIEADVIRWTEGIWRKARRNRGRAVNVGERMVIAEVIRDDGEWVDLLVRDCTVAKEIPGTQNPLLAKHAEARRKKHTIAKGNPERLLWSDETVRALLVSRHGEADNPEASP